MITPPILKNEQERLESLYKLDLLDTPVEERFDRVTQIAASLFDVPIALITLVETDRQWFKSCIGLDVSETGRDISFCGHAIEHDYPLIVEDAKKDVRFFDNPLVIGEPHISFYAGIPLLSPDGQALGTLCIIDHQPKKLDNEKIEQLKHLAKIVESEFALNEVYQQNAQFHAVQSLNKLITKAQSLFIEDSSDADVFEILLGEVLTLTECELGVIGEVFYDHEKNPYLKTNAVSRNAKNIEYSSFFEENNIEGLEFHNTESYLGQVLKTGEAVLVEAPLQHTATVKMPKGHPKLFNFLGIPIYYGDEIVAEIALANRKGGFKKEFINFLEPLTVTIGELIQFSRVKKANIEIHQSLKQFKHSVDLALDGVYMFDASSCQFFYVNKGACDQVGYSNDEMMQMYAYEIKPQFTASEFKKVLQSVIQSKEQSITFETLQQHKDGHKMNVEVVLQYFSSDVTPYFIAFSRDITGTKKIIDELKLGQQIFEHSHDCILVIDETNIIQKANASCEQLFGYSESELVGQHTQILNSNKHQDEFYDALWQEVSSKGRWQGEIWDRHKKGHLIPVFSSISTIYDNEGVVKSRVATLIDITKEKTAQERISRLAHYDSLTQLPNRKLSQDRLEHALKIAKRKQSLLYVMFIDLDDFKQVNDTYGHHIGDELLRGVASRLRKVFRAGDTVGRISGDEFVVIIEDALDSFDVLALIEKVFQSFTNPIPLEFGEYYVSVSIGVANFPEDGKDVNTILKHADLAMYSAKKNGKNKGLFYTQKLSKEIEGRLELHNDLRQACEKNQLQVFYQPIVKTTTKKCIAVESLCRWQHPDKGWISPADFIPIAETSSLIHVIGEWVLKVSCEHYVKWMKQGIELDFISINASGLQIMQEGFVNKVKQILIETKCPAEAISIELTESFAMQESEGAFEKIKALRDIGVTIAIDDFGTGYSSLSYLKKLPVQKIKLDRSFVGDIPDDPNDVAISKAIISLGKAVGMDIIAEGAETESQYQFLLQENCKYTQGFLFAKPMKAEDFVNFYMGR